MKIAIALFSFVLTVASGATTFAACSDADLLASGNQFPTAKNYMYGTRFTSVKNHGLLKPGAKTNVQVSIDDFDVENTRSTDVLVVSMYGTNVIGASFWLTQVDPITCKVISGSEVLGEGGAGL